MFSLILPCYNESLNIDKYLQELITLLKEKKYDEYEVVIVNDCSTDNSLELLENFQKKYPYLKIISHSINKGYGSALKTGILNAKYDIIIISDIDSTYPAKSVFELLEIYLQSKKNTTGYDMVIGQRTGKYLNESFFKKIFRYLLKKISEWSTGNKIYDVNSGLRVFSRKQIINFFPHLSNSFSFTVSSTLAYHLSNLSVKWFKIDYLKRNGSSHVRLFRDSLRTMQYVVSTILYFNPLKLFLLIGLILFALFMIAALTYFVNKSLFIMVFALIFFSMSIISILIGFISVVISSKKKKL
jgi:glycosyltransferase involved in cell wall biosynthesis